MIAQHHHTAERIWGRLTCACCAFYNRNCCTRFRCSHPECRIPLCNIGNGRVDEDSFALCHSDEKIGLAILWKYNAMKPQTIKNAKLLIKIKFYNYKFD